MAVVSAVALAHADDAESGPVVKGESGGVLGKHLALQGPDSGVLAGGDQRLQQQCPDTLAASVLGDIHTELYHPGMHAP